MDKVVKVLLKSVLLNIILVITKLIFGFLGTSKALIANAIHSLSDLITDVISILGYHLSKKNPTKKHPFGYGQLEYLTNIFVGIVIIFLGIETLSNAFSSKITIPSDIILFTSIMNIKSTRIILLRIRIVTTLKIILNLSMNMSILALKVGKILLILFILL